ncbi:MULTISPECIES: NnrU family protein [Roseobacteraceae]|uniref:NnrU protein n=1 Tax=Pseudosulfitobacter pseudonitzschiae TaxID=1402135 RepID=A0A221K624_9RHOB|nr:MULTISPECIES: NnrU family protein [Roseobacteraceae]ASM74449.1 NnrU protein [Pseudosulfitobacter pseudonitzschiae]
MTDWTEYVLALALFVASHFLPRIGGAREKLIAAIGRRTYFSVYGAISVALLVWVIAAAGRAPYIELWPHYQWMRWLPNVVMPVAIVLATCGAGLRQPFTLGGRRGQPFNPARSGVAAVSRHPLFLALALWAGTHLVANGDLAHVILFASFLAMPLAAILVFDARARQSLPPAEVLRFFTATALFSPRPLFQHDWLRENGSAMALRAAIGLLLWLALLHLHGAMIGASPFPF